VKSVAKKRSKVKSRKSNKKSLKNNFEGYGRYSYICKKIRIMKKFYSILVAVIFISAFTVSCAEDCKNCKTRTTNSSTSEVVEGTASEYCDEDLETVENEEPTTVGDVTSTWVCE
jgi:hypothetical protein